MEAMTSTPFQVGAMAKRAGAQRLVLTHFRKHMDDPAKHDAALAAGAAAFGAPIRIAKDLHTFDI